MSPHLMLARAFFLGSALLSLYGGAIAPSTVARADDQICPYNGCRDTEGNLCCSHTDGSNTYYYYPRKAPG